MRIGRLMTGAVAGVAVAALLATVFPTDDALAKRRRGKRGGKLRLADVNVGLRDGIEHNTVVEFKFTSNVDSSTVGAAIFRIRGENATRTGFTKQVPGTFQVRGRTVRFFPRLPTHVRNPDDPRGGFYPPGTERDDADENAGLQPLTNYEITVMGHPDSSPVRSVKGRALDQTYTTQFSTASIADRSAAFTINTYADAPPPSFRFSNPPDKVAAVEDLYAKRGGTQGVPSDIAVSLFGTKVPLAPSTVRKEGSVQLIQTERFGDPSLRKPVSGTPFVEQNFDTTRMFFVPDFPLPDLGVFALRVTNAVKDLTGLYDFTSNVERSRVRDIYEFLDTARRLSPTTPWEELQDPPAYLIFDWPGDAAERGVLKRNLLNLGDTYPDEIDPRVMVLFSTRDEPVSTGRLELEFVQADGYLDSDLSTAAYDEEPYPGTAAAIMTIAGGSGTDGDFEPVADEVIDTDGFPNNTINWRRIRIPPGVVVRLTGSRPVTIRAQQIDVEGEIYADGQQGDSAPTGSYLQTPKSNVDGGDGGPGGGQGGDSSDKFATSSDKSRADGEDGFPGHDENLIEAEPDDGGRGGEGGLAARNTTYYGQGGGGGGGGARLAGTKGADGTGSNGWAGKGGNGGAGSDNPELVPLVGGAGGAAGANGIHYLSQSWGVHSGAGGGGGGAVRFQTSGILYVGLEGVIGARGGRGGAAHQYSVSAGGPGGGGGGGSLLLQSSAGFDFADETNNLDVTGGFGATQSAGSYGAATFGGNGGLGYIRVESPSGGYAVPGGTTGVYDPVGGGVPSVVWTKWIDTGVDDPRMLNFTNDEFLVSASDDAILIEMQMAIEDDENFGSPKLDALDPDGGTFDPDEISGWTPVRYIDNTGADESAIPDIPNYNPSIHGKDHIFDIAGVMNGKHYKFVRFRITFQLSETQTSVDPMPYVDRLVMVFQFNF